MPLTITARGIAAVVLGLLVAGVFVRLGFWQLDRLSQRRAYNASVEAAMAQAPVRLDAAGFAAVSAEPEAHLYRRARAAGTLRPEAAVVLRGRAHAGNPGVHVVVPLELEEGGTVLVNRGWLPSRDAATVDLAPVLSGGSAEVEGWLLELPRTADRGAPAEIEREAGTVVTYRRLDHDEMAARAPGPLLPLYLQELPGASAVAGAAPVPVEAPEMTEGNHLGYAVQWFGFAAIAVIGLGLLVFRGTRSTRAPGPAPEPLPGGVRRN